MAPQAECAHICEIALSAAFRYGKNMVRVPEGFAAAFAKSPVFQETASGRVVETAHVAAQRGGVGLALRADTFVTFENFIAQVTGIGSQFPFVDAGF